MASAKTTKPFHLYTMVTPNGVVPSIYLEELKTAYPDKTASIDYDATKIDISTNVQKEDWFIKLNPNGRIPVLVDQSRNNFAVFETSAILLYLAQHYDPEHKFSFSLKTQPDEYSEMIQWLFFAHGGIGPMQGQNHHFNKYAPEDIPYGKKRYLDETKRLYGVLDIRLKDREYLAGAGKGKYSLADIKTFPWIKIHAHASIPTLDEFPNLKAWLERCVAREASEVGWKVAA